MTVASDRDRQLRGIFIWTGVTVTSAAIEDSDAEHERTRTWACVLCVRATEDSASNTLQGPWRIGRSHHDHQAGVPS